MSSVLYVFLALILISICYTDITRRKIKNTAVIAVALLSLLLSVTTTGTVNFLWPLVILVTGMLLVFASVIGAGDIKLIAALCLSVPVGNIAGFIFWVTLSGIPLILIVVILRLILPDSKKMTLPYGVAISCGYLLNLLG